MKVNSIRPRHASLPVSAAVPEEAPVQEELPSETPPAATVPSPAPEDAVKVSLRSDECRGHARGFAKKLAKLDSDGDGSLSRSELEAAPSTGRTSKVAERILSNYEALDSNADGLLNLKELHPRLIAKARSLAVPPPPPR